MECYYHPTRDSTDVCAICGKSICKECGLEIAGKVYCKECLEKIVGLGLDNKQSQPAASQEPIQTEPARLNKQPVEDDIYQPPREPQAPKIENVPQPEPEPQPIPEIKQINDDSPYNIKDNINYSGNLESSYLEETEPIMQAPEVEQKPAPQPQITQQPINEEPEYIYPDHSYEPQPTSARMELEDKYERYLDDLYFDENEVPLNEQLAKDEEQYGSLTRKPYQPRPQKAVAQKKAPINETPEEMEARIRAEILKEKGEHPSASNKGIHNIQYKDEKEPMSVIDIVLTVILVIVILVVIYYLVYIFLLKAYYPTFTQALYGLTNPQNVINNILSH